MQNLFAAFSADMDVAEAGANFSSVNVPFALGYVYEPTLLAGAAGWTFDPTIFSPPFFAGLRLRRGQVPEEPGGRPATEVGLTLFSNTINGGAFDDAQNTTQLFRYISNNINAGRRRRALQHRQPAGHQDLLRQQQPRPTTCGSSSRPAR